MCFRQHRLNGASASGGAEWRLFTRILSKESAGRSVITSTALSKFSAVCLSVCLQLAVSVIIIIIITIIFIIPQQSAAPDRDIHLISAVDRPEYSHCCVFVLALCLTCGILVDFTLGHTTNCHHYGTVRILFTRYLLWYYVA
jgi:hypothetical protein